ncbi:MAG: PQQ-dependent sugar dehydrogenase [Planctomycetota bacterium]|nr:PQQ-dependent sugar dehydrogenase [Planctomycetota bacterium]
MFLTHAGDGSNRLFVVEQAGRIRAFENGPDVKAAKVFLDIRPQVRRRHNEEGLLALAFHPQYRKNGHLYVYYSASRPRRGVLSRFTVSADDPDQADPASEQVILEVEQPWGNHNGATVLFGPDGYLYLSLGDGGQANDPLGSGQDLSTLLGRSFASTWIVGRTAVPTPFRKTIRL